MDNWQGDGGFDVKGTIVPGDHLLTPSAQILPKERNHFSMRQPFDSTYSNLA
jgi:hypothetical protein